jgi:integrase
MAGPVSDYLVLFPTATTAHAYRLALARFSAFLDGKLSRSNSQVSYSPDDLAAMDAAAVAYFEAVRSGTRSAASDIVHFLAGMQAVGFAPTTIAVNRSALIGFLEENGIELSRLDERRIKKRLPRHRGVVEEEIITREHLQTISPLLGVRDRAVTLVLLASGARIGETLKLRIRDVDLDAEPARVVFREETTKNKERRISFLTPEAVDAVRVWLRVRDDYIQTAARRNVGLVTQGHSRPKSLDDERLFPFARGSFDLGWTRALQRADLFRSCERTGRTTIHPHGLRKAFRSWFGAVAGPDAAEVLMGHSGYMETYRKYTEEDLRQVYLKHCHVLTVTGESGKLAREVADLQKKNAVLEQRLSTVLVAVEERNRANEQIWGDPRFRAELEDAVRRMQVEVG